MSMQSANELRAELTALQEAVSHLRATICHALTDQNQMLFELKEQIVAKCEGKKKITPAEVDDLCAAIDTAREDADRLISSLISPPA